MKKIFSSILFCLFILLAFSGCGTAEQSDEKTATALPTMSFDNEVKYLVNEDSGTQYAVYFYCPQSNQEEYTFQSEQMRSASMIKVFLLGAAMEQVQNGNLSLTQPITLNSYDKVGGSGILSGYASGTTLPLTQVLNLMITVSDNTATNMIIDLLGMDNINDYIQREGYTDTVLQRKMMDSQAVAEGRENYTSVRDLGHFFKKLYNRNCVSPELDDVMLNYLAGQTDTEIFPTALPDMMIAHKTGELTGLFDDGGIFYQENAPFILVCMTEHYSSRGTAIYTMQQIARNAAEYSKQLSANATATAKKTENQVQMVEKPVLWNEERKQLTEEYAQKHYGVSTTELEPRAVVLHWTAGSTWDSAYNHFYAPAAADGTLNYASHFIVDKDGTIYHILPEKTIGRHIIGYNWCAIGIENVGGVNGKEDLTEAQVTANVKLIRYLKEKYPTIQYVFGHYQQDEARSTGLYREDVNGYHSNKIDPGAKFMQAVQAQLKDSHDLTFFKP